MSRVLPLLRNEGNRGLLSTWIDQQTEHEVVSFENDEPFAAPFDLCIIDVPALSDFRAALKAHRKQAQPEFVPVLLLVPSEHSRRLNDAVWDYVDDIIWTSVGEQKDSLDTFEFTGRVRSLLRARSMSQTVIEDQQRLKVLHRVLRHNLRNSLNIVRGSATSIEGPDAADNVNRIVRETDRLLGHSEKAQDIEKILEQSAKQEIDLDGRVQQVIDKYADEFPDADISLEVRSSVRVTSIVGITRTIEEIIHNSLIHAARDTPSVAITVDQVDGFGVVTVEDSNPTISEQDEQVLQGDLDPTALDHGSGVGLWLVVWTVRRSNGQIQYQALESEGNRIQIRLPTHTPD